MLRQTVLTSGLHTKSGLGMIIWLTMRISAIYSEEFSIAYYLKVTLLAIRKCFGSVKVEMSGPLGFLKLVTDCLYICVCVCVQTYRQREERKSSLGMIHISSVNAYLVNFWMY